MHATLSAVPSPIAASASRLRDYITLLKPGVMSLVVFTGLAGLMVTPGHLGSAQILVTLLCIALGSGAGGALNMWYDRDIDALMTRTRNRPLPAGRLAPSSALALGLFLALFAVALLGYAVNLLAAAILAFAIFFYAVIYTMLLKRATPQNIVIGGAAGAFPPLIGQVAVSAHISLYGIVLFLIVFLWTPPHFWALALYRNGDYAAAGVPMLPVTAGLAATRRQIVFYSYLLVPVTLAPVFLHEAGLVYALAALYCGYRFLRHVRSLFMQADDASARKLFGYSILYLFVLFGFLMIDKAGDMLMKPLILNGLAL